MQTLSDATAEYGEKAHNLAKIMKYVPVPNGFAIHPDDVRSSGITRRIMNRYRDEKIAVRSSALGEDGKDVSFAGQHDTLLNVECTPNNLWAAITQVRDSVNKSKNYQETNGAEVTRMGVIVQRMVEPVLSGVMFTSDPTTGDYSTSLIEYVMGLGDKLVGGEVNPDGRVRVKDDKFTVEIAHPYEWSAQRLIQAGHILADKLNQGPLDIEWALNSNGMLIFLQARPITGVNWSIEGEGRVAHKGIVEGKGRWVHGAHDDREVSKRFNEGDILLTRMTDPRMIDEMILSAGMATMIGGQTCHAAIVARELGKPCVIGAGDIVKAFVGINTVIDANNGRIYATGS